MAVGAVAYLRQWDAFPPSATPSARAAEGPLPARPTEDGVAHWLVFYIDFLRTFPWKRLALNPTAIFAGSDAVKLKLTVYPIKIRRRLGNNILSVRCHRDSVDEERQRSCQKSSPLLVSRSSRRSYQQDIPFLPSSPLVVLYTSWSSPSIVVVIVDCSLIFNEIAIVGIVVGFQRRPRPRQS